MYRKEDVLHIDQLELYHHYEPRTQSSDLYVIEHNINGKSFAYKVVKEEYNSSFEAPKFLSLGGGFSSVDVLKTTLQKIVDFAYDNFKIIPTRYILESSTQAAHLRDMRKLVSHHTGVELDN
jgi:hypothetical protein